MHFFCLKTFFLLKTASAMSCVKPNTNQWKATLYDDVGFRQYIVEFTVEFFSHYPIRRRVTYASALELWVKR